MTCYKLRAYLNNLTLVGFEDGDYQWVGTTSEWSKMQNEIISYEELNY
jgi:hypothetical protein